MHYARSKEIAVPLPLVAEQPRMIDRTHEIMPIYDQLEAAAEASEKLAAAGLVPIEAAGDPPLRSIAFSRHVDGSSKALCVGGGDGACLPPRRTKPPSGGLLCHERKRPLKWGLDGGGRR